MPKPIRPKLVNRGPAGLLKKTGASTVETLKTTSAKVWAKNKITQGLRDAKLIVSINSLTPDPDNARKHPDRNMDAIRASLHDFGQVKPVVVRQQNNVIAAGNGTHAGALSMGWTEIAAVYVPMSDVEFAAFGLADNRTAELAKWDFEIVARLHKLISDAGQQNIGWSTDELEVLRMADWTPPTIDENAASEHERSLTLKFNPDQKAIVLKVLEYKTRVAKALDKPEPKTEVDALILMCEMYVRDFESSIFDNTEPVVMHKPRKVKF